MINMVRLKMRLARRHNNTILQQTRGLEQRNRLLRLLRNFRGQQDELMPAFSYLFSSYESLDSQLSQVPEDICLYLPADLDVDRRRALDPALVSIAPKFHLAAMSDSLDELCHQLRLKACLSNFKIHNITGQRQNTRARITMESIQAAVLVAAETYRVHREAYGRLVGSGPWEKQYRELKVSDIVSPGDRLVQQMEADSKAQAEGISRYFRGGAASGESRHTVSWIWYNVTDSPTVIDDGGSSTSRFWSSLKHYYRFEGRMDEMSCSCYALDGGTTFIARRNESWSTFYGLQSCVVGDIDW
jgi:hypothetical protein